MILYNVHLLCICKHIHSMGVICASSFIMVRMICQLYLTVISLYICAIFMAKSGADTTGGMYMYHDCNTRLTPEHEEHLADSAV